MQELFTFEQWKDGVRFTLKDFNCLSLRGVQTQDFLHRQTTASLSTLSNQSAQINTLLDKHGRLLSWFFLLKKSSDHILLLIPREWAEQSEHRLSDYLIMEEIEFEKPNHRFHLFFGSDGSGRESMTESFSFSHDKLGHWTFTEGEESSVGPWAFFAGLGLPRPDVDLSRPTLVTETMLIDYAVEFDKGCFLGQETVAKIHHRKGAPQGPVCLEIKKPFESFGGSLPLTLYGKDEKKMASTTSHHRIGNEEFFYAVAKNALRFSPGEHHLLTGDQKDVVVQVNLFPLFTPSPSELAQGFYDEAVECFQQDRTSEAIERLIAAIELCPSFADAYEVLGAIYGRERDYSKAIEYMEKLLEQQPESVMAHTNLSVYHMKLGDKETAEDHKAKATVNQFKAMGKKAQEKKSQQREKQNQLKERAAMFEQVLELDAADFMANVGLSDIHRELGELEKAKNYAELAVQEHPNQVKSHLSLAQCLMAQGRPETTGRVEQHLKKAVELAKKKGEWMPLKEAESLLAEIGLP